MKTNLIFRSFLVVFTVITSSPSYSYFPDNRYFHSDLNPSLDSALGDFDGDGDLDAFVTINSDSGNLVLLNDGTGYLIDSGQHLGNTQSSGVELGDVDGDGDLDALVYGSGFNHIWLNDGKAVFSPGKKVATDGKFGDIDGDGDLDIVSPSVSAMWLNDGHGNFTDSGRFIGNGDSSLIALFDIDADGDLDAVIDGHLKGYKVFRNSGTGIFSSTGQTLAGYRSGFISPMVGDIDKDGDLDIVIVTEHGAGSRILRNDGNGLFTDSSIDLTGTQFDSFRYPIDNYGALLIDVDRDGYPDIFIAHGTSSAFGIPNEVWLNDGTGAFTNSNLALGYNNSKSVSSGDMNGDGYTDVYVTNFRQKNHVWLNNGNVNFTPHGGYLGNEDSQSVNLGDLDNDGDLDAFVANGSSTSSGASFANLVWLNDGDGVFVNSGQRLGNSNSQDSSLADLDGDGDLDVFVSNKFVPNNPGMSQQDEIWFNDGKGHFTRSSYDFGDVPSLAVALGDIDGDSDIDIVISNFTVSGPSVSFELSIWTNNGAGVFAKSSSLSLENTSYSVKLGDFNGDGTLDIFAVGLGKNHKLFLNDGRGNFKHSADLLNDQGGQIADIGDLDGDEDLDIFVISSAHGSSSVGYTVWLNDGAGKFQNTGLNLGSKTGSYASIKLTDLDQDGDLDAFIGARGMNELWLNDGNGYFHNAVVNTDSAPTTSVALGDLDGDGDIDAFIANEYQHENAVWLNQWVGPITRPDHREADRKKENILDPLKNDYDPIGKGLTLVNTDRTSLHGGSLSKKMDNTISYTPAKSTSGIDRFTYKISDDDGNTAVGVMHIALTENSSGNADTPATKGNDSSGSGPMGLWILIALMMNNIICLHRIGYLGPE